MSSSSISSSSKSSSSSSSFSDCGDISVNDNFTGLDNTQPSPNRWLVSQPTGTYLKQNQLYQRPQPVGLQTYARTKYTICGGDFKAETDFEIDTSGPVTFGDSTQFIFEFVVNGVTDFAYLQVLVRKSPLFYEWFSPIRAGGVNVSITTGSLGNTIGRIRLQRVGSTFNIYLDEGAGWVLVNTASGVTPLFTGTGWLRYRALTGAPSHPDNKIFWDNLTVTADCVNCASSSSSSTSSSSRSSSSLSSSSRSSSSSSSSRSSSSSNSSSSSSSSSNSSSSSSSSSSKSSSSTSSSSSAVAFIIPGITEDAYITAGNGVIEQHNFGATRYLIVGGVGSNASKAIIKFDLSELSDYISNESEILSAFLYFKVGTNRLSSSTVYSLHRIKKEWSGGDGYGGVPERGEVSWVSAKTGIQNWENPGAGGSSGIGPKITTVTVLPNTTPELSLDVTSAVKYAFTNADYNGFLLQFYSGDQQGTIELASLDYLIESNRPYLQVNI